MGVLFSRASGGRRSDGAALTAQFGQTTNPFAAYRTKTMKERTVRESSLLSLSLDFVADHLHTFSRSELRELPDDILQLLLEKCIEHGTLRADNIKCFVSARGIYKLLLRDYPLVDDAWVAAFAGPCDLRVVDLSRCRFLTDQALRALSVCPTIRALTLGDAPAISDEGLRALTAGLIPSLKALSLTNLPGLTAHALASLGALTNLTELQVSKCPGLEGDGLRNLARLVNLESLTLAWNLRVTDDFLCAAPFLASLTHLELRSVHVSDASLWIRSCRALSSLRLVNCGLDDGCLGALGKLTGLGALDLSSNQVSSSALTELSALGGLTSVRLNHSPCISGQGLRALRAMPYLKDLSLDSCPLPDAALLFIKYLTDLERLDLSDTAVSDAVMEPIGALVKLKALELGQTEITTTGVRCLKALRAVTSLNLDCRGVDDGAIEHLRGMAGLEALDLYSAKITDDGMQLLCAAFPRLKRLEVCGGYVSNRGCEHLPLLRNLRDINLSHNKLGDRALASLARCPRLAWVNLSHTRVTDQGLVSLAPLSRLRDLRLSSTRVSPAGVETLRALLPQMVSIEAGE